MRSRVTYHLAAFLMFATFAGCASGSHIEETSPESMRTGHDPIAITIVNHTGDEIRVTLMNGGEPIGATLSVQPMVTVLVRRAPHELTQVYAIVKVPGARASTRETDRIPVADAIVLEIDALGMRWRIVPPR